MKETLLGYIRDDLLDGRAGIEIEGSTDLLGSGLLDSLSMMSLVFHLEEAFGVRVPPEDVTIENFVSVDAIEAYLGRAQEGGSS